MIVDAFTDACFIVSGEDLEKRLKNVAINTAKYEKPIDVAILGDMLLRCGIIGPVERIEGGEHERAINIKIIEKGNPQYENYDADICIVAADFEFNKRQDRIDKSHQYAVNPFCYEICKCNADKLTIIHPNPPIHADETVMDIW
jgi:hypothetical protein